MGKLNSLWVAPHREMMGTQALNSGLCVAGTTGITTTVTIQYAISGIYAVAKTAMTNNIITNITGPLNGVSATSYTAPANVTFYLVFCLDSAGLVSVVQGSYAGQPLGNGATGNGDVPDVPSTVCPFAMAKVATTAVFTAGTTSFGTGNTATFYNLMVLPATNP